MKGKKNRLCKYGPWCERSARACFYIHEGDPEYEDAIKRDPGFRPLRPGHLDKQMHGSPDRGWGSRRRPRDRSRSKSRDRSPRRDDQHDRRDDYSERWERPREHTRSRDRTPTPPPVPRSRIPPSSRPLTPPRGSSRLHGFDSSNKPISSTAPRDRIPSSPSNSSSSYNASSRDKDLMSRRLSTATTLSASSSNIPTEPRASKSLASMKPTDKPKAERDSTFQPTGLGQKKAENPFKAPAAPSVPGSAPKPTSSTTQPSSKSEVPKQSTASGSSSQTQKSWKPVGASAPQPPQEALAPAINDQSVTPSAPPALEKTFVQTLPQDKGKGKAVEVPPTPMEVVGSPNVAAKITSERPRFTREQWAQKIRLLVEAVNKRAKQQIIRAELNELKRCESKYSVKGEQNQRGYKRLMEAMDQKVAEDKAAVSELRRLCSQLASSITEGDGNNNPVMLGHDGEESFASPEVTKTILDKLEQLEMEVREVSQSAAETSKTVAGLMQDVSEMKAQSKTHDADGDIDMGTAAEPSSSASRSQTPKRSLSDEISELNNQIELLEQGLDDARNEVENARIQIHAQIDALPKTPEEETDRQFASDTELAQHIVNLETASAIGQTVIENLVQQTSGMTLAALREENVELRKRLDDLEVDRIRRNKLIEMIAGRVAHLQAPTLPPEQLKEEIFNRTTEALVPVLERMDNQNREAVVTAQHQLTETLRDGLREVSVFFQSLKNAHGSAAVGLLGPPSSAVGSDRYSALKQ